MTSTRSTAARRLAALLLAAIAAACSRAAPGPVAVAGPAVDPFRAAVADGEKAWGERADPARLDAAAAALRKAAALRPGLPDVELRLARAEALRALGAPSVREATEGWDAVARAGERALRTLSPPFAEAIDRGDDAVEAARKVGAEGAEPLYWLAVGQLKKAQATGAMAVMVTKDVVLGLLGRVVELDERLDRAGPHRWLGALCAALPAAAGGGVARAREHFERARALAPEDPLRPVAEAETLAVLLQDATWFDALLADVQARDPAKEPALAAEIGVARRLAAALAARRSRLF